MNSQLLNYYEAIEHASQDMLEAARTGNWDQVVKLEGACALLISQLKHAAAGRALGEDEAQLKSRIMQRILVNDAEIRHLAEPWLEQLDDMLAGRPKTPALNQALSRCPRTPCRCRWTSLAAAPGGLDEFRITAPREIAAMLKQFQDGNVLLNLNGSNGAMLSTTLWSIDAARGQLSFSADAGSTGDAEARRMRGGGRRRLPRQHQGAVRRAGPGAGARHGRQRDQRTASRASCSASSAATPSACARCCAARRWRACATR